ncbi:MULTISPECIES: hypothetical protein [unclassified Streptomyces]|uniref:hypothetical protein n=1 Tax=unclassified Streptomyces TaxID=2593676 RepID=UPI002258D037|nr:MULTISPECIES: hypothetical protein [unclassified Streptomyces]MCX4527729.1 hypothetical protein [Streptomyces sp. NBC_01551]MCX4541673.1 hypothetical protein [Streptomyces sp. NBC_01565]
MSARRPLLTALGATTLLAALSFVPSANATSPGDDTNTTQTAQTSQTTQIIQALDTPASDAGTPDAPALALADTGGVDTTPYLLGGTLCLGLGAGFVAFSVRRRSQAG